MLYPPQATPSVTDNKRCAFDEMTAKSSSATTVLADDLVQEPAGQPARPNQFGDQALEFTPE
ncbi:hypothetical protein [Deinococcus altitudinis]|uniref:hypothetical protein n=1 Tax=Deinococcus altitudinis TaxID=468914 RepID=UPI0038920D77